MEGGVATTMRLWMTSLQDRDRNPLNRDVDNEAQAAAAGRQGGGGRAGGAPAGPTAPPTVTIDWEGLPERAVEVTIPGTSVSSLTASPDGRSVAIVGKENELEDIWVLDTERGTRTRLSTAKASYSVEAWTPDGRSLVYSEGSSPPLVSMR